PQTCDGRPTIIGTNISVHRIAALYQQKLTPEEIVKSLDNLTFAQVYAALTYYHANQEKITQDLAEERPFKEPSTFPPVSANTAENSSNPESLKDAVDIARYFLCCVDREAGDTISPLKLQKLVYYAQVWSLVLRDKPLFYQEIEAWMYGPVVRDVWNKYQDYKYRDIPAPAQLNATFAEDEIEILEEVWDNYGELSARQLTNLAQSETPWLKAREGLELAQNSTNTISHDDIKSCYHKLLET
ncbi:MAG: DUF4065 domain-containing protein, partial [Okeania sp. SIO2D1]|nr:DUF4065 domain-containing protein [Okeania sp. SIO2D1]